MIRITDSQWRVIRKEIPSQKFSKGGRPRANDKRTMEGILWVLKHGEQWSHLPKKYGAYVTCWRRFKEWDESGVWPKLWRAYFVTLEHKQKLSWTLALWDGAIIPTRNTSSSR